MTVGAILLVGLAAGAHTSTWGMYKDAAHEGFTWRKYGRSILLSSCIAPILVILLRLPAGTIGDLLVLFGVTYVLERGVAEFYKTFLRQEDQGKYFIPMQFAVLGQVVHCRRTRAFVGVAVAMVALALAAGVFLLQPEGATRPPWLAFAAAGGLAGLCSAVGGAWKDAPIEGFETFKFFRSPFIAAVYALLLANFTNSLLLAGAGGLGFTVATIETYKKFFFPSKPPGKFAGKPIQFPRMLALRNWFVPVYAGIWALLLAGFAAALSR